MAAGDSQASVAVVRRLAREQTEPAVKRIVELMQLADRDSVCLAAAQTLLAYGHGKPGNASDSPEREYIRTLLAKQNRNMTVPELVQFMLGRIEMMQSYLEELGRMTQDEQQSELARLVGAGSQ